MNGRNTHTERERKYSYVCGCVSFLPSLVCPFGLLPFQHGMFIFLFHFLFFFLFFLKKNYRQVRVYSLAISSDDVRILYDEFRRQRLGCLDPGDSSATWDLAFWPLAVDGRETVGGLAGVAGAGAVFANNSLVLTGSGDSFLTVCENAAVAIAISIILPPFTTTTKKQ
jgi:hypothetical protein